MPLAEKGARGKAAGLAPPQHTETRSAISAPNFGSYFSVTPFLGVIGDRADY
jgi:hypothetical protein